MRACSDGDTRVLSGTAAPGGSDGQEHLHEFPRVRQEHRNAVAVAQTERAQSRRGASYGGIEFPMREFAPAFPSIEIDQGDAGRPSGGGPAQDEADIHSCPSVTAAMPHHERQNAASLLRNRRANRVQAVDLRQLRKRANRNRDGEQRADAAQHH